MNVCDCDETLGNTGIPGCNPIEKSTVKLIIVPTYDSTGTRNSMTIATLFTPTLLSNNINDTDLTQRWFPTPKFNNVGGERAESKFATDAFGRKEKLIQGVRTFTGEFWGQAGVFLGQIQKANCNDFSAYKIDVNGSITGMISADADGKLYPIKMEKGSFDAIYMPETPEVKGMVKISFEFDNNEQDSLLRTISADDMTADLLNANGLIDVNSVITSITTTSFTAKLVTKYGSVKNPVVDKYLLIGDFALYNVTDSAAVTIATMTESTPGTYVFTYTAQTSADVLRLTPTKTGRDYTLTIANTILIP
jgi:hypothetical protein